MAAVCDSLRPDYHFEMIPRIPVKKADVKQISIMKAIKAIGFELPLNIIASILHES